MPKIIGVAVGLLILKGGEILVLYHTMPILRRLWVRVLAPNNSRYSLEPHTFSFYSAKRTALTAILKTLHTLSQTTGMGNLHSAKRQKEDD